jgi:hypothetical protein
MKTTCLDGKHQLLDPTDGNKYNWNELTLSWDLVNS